MNGDQIGSITKAWSETMKSLRPFTDLLAKALGEPLETAGQIVNDRLLFYRFKRKLAYAQKCNELLKERNLEQIIPVPFKFSIPIFENAIMEDDDYLQQLWANLLVNAMDPNRKFELNISYIDILKNLAPMDARILELLFIEVENLEISEKFMLATNHEVIKEELSLSESEYSLSMNNLFRLRCVQSYIRHYESKFTDSSIKYSKKSLQIMPNNRAAAQGGLSVREYGIFVVQITPLGYQLVENCKK